MRLRLGEVGERADGLDAKVKKLDEELIKYREQLKKLRPNSPAANAIKARAMRVLKQKKMYETQREQLYGQSFNMEQAAFATQSMQDTVTTVTAMKQANQTLKTQFKSIKVNEIEVRSESPATLCILCTDVLSCFMVALHLLTDCRIFMTICKTCSTTQMRFRTCWGARSPRPTR